MKGHEYPRELIKAMLTTQVPLRLEALRARLTTDPEAPVEWPVNPNSYQLADQLPMKEEQFPCVLISSTEATRNAHLQPGLGETVFDYTMTVTVAVTSSRHGGDEEASVGRDRIMLAVREALMLNADLADDAYSIVRDIKEQTGAPAENLQSKPLALGNLGFSVRVVEDLTDPLLDTNGDAVVVATHDETVSAVDSSQT